MIFCVFFTIMVCGGKGSIKMGIYANERAFFFMIVYLLYCLMGGYMSSARIEFGVN